MSEADRAEVESLFERALDLAPAERTSFLDRSAPRPSVRAAVERLLAAHDRAGILERPIRSIAEDVDATVDAAEASATPSGRIGPYEILEELGRGGMGVVMKARDHDLGRIVAMKFLTPEAAETPERRARFAAEARAASILDHPGVARVYDVGETEDGSVYLVMAHCEGRTLDRLIAEGPLDLALARTIARGVAEGLACAHRAGIIHRDVKPSNIMIGETQEPRILDFGIAKVADAPALTRTGMRLGTVAYMAPEQARGERVDARADVWSLGVVLYEMLTGERPFHGRTPAATVQAILLTDPAPPSARRPEVPPELDRVVMRTLAKSRDERFRDIPAFLAALDPGSDAPGGAATRVDTLHTDTRRLLGRLSVLPVTFTLDDIEHVASLPEGPLDDVFDALDELLAESLVEREDAGEGSRFRLRDAAREAARAELLAAGEAAAAARWVARR